jgi:hypothetical protein
MFATDSHGNPLTGVLVPVTDKMGGVATDAAGNVRVV